MRESNSDRKIALLATGDEIVHGDIVNTNSRDIARQLIEHHMTPGTQMVASDHIDDIEQAIRYLLQNHDALIMTGGLGPTSDDITRYALSKALNLPLVFHDHVWDNIVQRLHRFGYDTPPESNRQQALFPAGSIVIPNDAGTAAGCRLEHNDKQIFMLPGPPTECLPMLESIILKQLQQTGFAHESYHANWLLFSVSEGQIAETLDAIAAPLQCQTGYRLSYPYLEFKLYSKDKAQFKMARKKIEEVIQPYLIRDGRQSASRMLRDTINHSHFPLRFCDLATGGLLEHTLKTPHNKNHIQFVSEKDLPNIVIRGLEDYWNDQNTTETKLIIEFLSPFKQNSAEKSIPFRGKRVVEYAVELICKQCIELLHE
ncbi:MAG: competence/damage-inducible protein A [Gammaproteobacteria bacterium]|nr:competence/damage-inducible protein A [Gammaproteobacteria bacterium]